MDVFTIMIPETHLWAVFIGWIAVYGLGRALNGGRL